MSIKRSLILFLLLSILAIPLTAAINTEVVTARFVRAFQEGSSFADISKYFFKVSDLDAFINHLRSNLPEGQQRQAADKILQELQEPTKRQSIIKKITREREKAQIRWEMMLKYPVDEGTKINLKRMRITINYTPFKNYEAKVSGQYTSKGIKQTFRLRLEFLIFNREIKIVKFR